MMPEGLRPIWFSPLTSVFSVVPRRMFSVPLGSVDEMECVFYKAGIDASEFTVPSSSGRIHMYRANGARMGTGCGCGGSCGRPGNDGPCDNAGTETQAGCLAADASCVWTPSGTATSCTSDEQDDVAGATSERSTHSLNV